MQQINRHTISVFKWDTSFDNKENAFDLQQRISEWSKHKLLREVGEVLDKICPSGQLWKIQSLEINLGQIDYNNLEAELSLTLRELLTKQITDLIHSDNNSTNPFIQIESEEVSRLNVLEVFLLSGIAQSSIHDASINQLISVQLKNNYKEVIDLIRRIGTRSENVRKRIVWQFAAADFIEVVRGLEPNNHNQIIDFSVELTKIQSKKNIVKSDAKDFEKNLWLWILNYLLVEKGSLFNRIDFMRSSIKQMANHYNVRYKDLLRIIEDAINTIRQRDSIRPDFIIALKILTDENKINSDLNEQESLKDHWKDFELLLRDASLRRSTEKKRELNELLTGLYRENKKRFKELLRTLEDSEEQWTLLIRDLTKESCGILILSYTESQELIHSIYFLEELCEVAAIKVEKKAIWIIAARFVAGHKSSSITANGFLEYCMDELAKKNNEESTFIALSLVNAEIPWKNRRISHAEIFSSIASYANKEITMNTGALKEGRFKNIFQRIDLLINQGTNGTVLEQAREVLVRNIYSDPASVVKFISTHTDKNQVEKILNGLMDVSLAQKLVQNAHRELNEVVLEFTRLAEQFKLHQKDRSLNFFFEGDVWLTAAMCIVRDPLLKPSQLFKNLLKELIAKIPEQQLNTFKVFIETIPGQSHALVKEIKRLSRRQEVMQLVFENKKLVRLISVSQNPFELGKFFNANFLNNGFTSFRKSAHTDRHKVMNYFVSGSEQMMSGLIKKFEKLISSRTNEKTLFGTKYKLEEIYWKSLLHYNKHHGNTRTFERIFSEAVFFHFSLSGKRQGAPLFKDLITGSGKRTVVLKNGLTLTRNELFECLASLLGDTAKEVVFKEKNVSLEEVLSIGLSLDPGKITRLFARTEITDKRIKDLKASITFSEFVSWASNSKALWFGEKAGILIFLYELVEEMASVGLARKLHKSYWQIFWNMIKTNKWSDEEALRLIESSFQKIGAASGIGQDEIIALVKKKNTRLTPVLKKFLVNCLRETNKIESINSSTASDKLLLIEKKGLLDNTIHQIIFTQQLPVWYITAGKEKPEDLLNECITYYPFKFYAGIKHKIFTEIQLNWLHRVLDFKELMTGIAKLNKNRTGDLEILTQFYFSLAHITAAGISSAELQYLLFRKIILALANDNWRTIAIGNIWHEISWDVFTKRGIDKKQFMESVTKIKTAFPPALQIAWEHLKEENKPAKSVLKKTEGKEMSIVLPVQRKNDVAIRTGIKVRNAGLVLLNSYVPLLFERLAIINKERKYVSPEARLEAVHYLQYVVTGLCETEESFLPLNKVLCGINISEPVHSGIHITEENKKLVSGLINAAIGFWPSAGDTSIQGFRGNWLVRDGILKEQDDRWELNVEKRVYDLLIHKSPFTFSIIKFPWMLKPLHVTWPY